MQENETEWLQSRLGRVTASRIDEVLAGGKSRQNYFDDIIEQRRTGARRNEILSDVMRRGMTMEAEARLKYEQYRKKQVQRAGFYPHPTIPDSGATPDGLVGADGLLEIKCPTTRTHLRTVEDDEIALRYRRQMLFQLACTRRKWCDFVSYDPRVRGQRRFYVKRFQPTQAEIQDVEDEVRQFVLELNKSVPLEKMKVKEKPPQGKPASLTKVVAPATIATVKIENPPEVIRLNFRGVPHSVIVTGPGTEEVRYDAGSKTFYTRRDSAFFVRVMAELNMPVPQSGINDAKARPEINTILFEPVIDNCIKNVTALPQIARRESKSDRDFWLLVGAIIAFYFYLQSPDIVFDAGFFVGFVIYVHFVVIVLKIVHYFQQS